MEAEELEKILSEALKNCLVTVEAQGNHFHIKAVGDVFRGLSAVKRQQLIYSHINPFIQSGAVHAVTMDLSCD